MEDVIIKIAIKIIAEISRPLVWIKKFSFEMKFKSVNFGFDNAYQKKNFRKTEVLYCFVCGDNGRATPLVYDSGYGEWDHKCQICEKTFNMYKEIKVDFYRR
ncbi:MAG: hypothetical protein KAS01_02630 [Candidatus Pacebacteria bacterium]|nr:hypothetical protein [Candidatus Paceibacterota bacterium]